ncbi:uncharacterized protein E0L32_002427 [Thyridium curvatum]|uniref:Rhodopsin domain-containing protein n=1 Tax=Thyridium curvatum TaxID=1093900 RepID=A0A507BP84_9PEZI|nr:uncharacterized protein E0L32_002427 [Thyridium curvatum]TPX18570.1 hypothetical protein E0L32_002427 [Thyridium curvatum]
MAMEDRGPELAAVCWTFVTTAFVATALRCYVRTRIVKRFGLDDWTMLAALVSFIIFIACTLCGIHYGTGRHFWDLEEQDIEMALKFWWHCYYWYCVTIILSKVSIAAFLLRIAVSRVGRAIIYIVAIATVVSGVVFFFVNIFQCRPVSFYWNQHQPGTCLDNDVIIGITYAYSSFSVVCDFTLTLLPIGFIFTLHMDTRSKIALIPIMAMGSSAAVVIRFFYIHDFNNPDFLYATLDIAIWSIAECGLAIIAGCLATLRPLFRIVGQKFGLAIPGPTILNRGAMFSLPTIKNEDVEDNRTANGSNLDSNTTGERASMWLPQDQEQDQEQDQPDKSREELTVGH